MAHYAFLDENNLVTEVIVGIDETELIEGLDPETWYGNFRGQTCKRTSYNTANNKHKNGKTPFRGNYAGVSWVYDPVLDVFVSPKPYSSWILNKDTYDWKAPVAYPTDGKTYTWDEDSTSWVEVTE